MRIMQIAGLALAATLLGSITHSQAPAPAGGNSGYKPSTVLSRPEIRVMKIDLQPGAVRAIHSHNDPNVFYNLFLPITAGIELTLGSDGPVMTEPGQAYYVAKGTPHGFRNTSTTPGMVYEVFVQDPAIPLTPHGPNAPKGPGSN